MWWCSANIVLMKRRWRIPMRWNHISLTKPVLALGMQSHWIKKKRTILFSLGQLTYFRRRDWAWGHLGDKMQKKRRWSIQAKKNQGTLTKAQQTSRSSKKTSTGLKPNATTTKSKTTTKVTATLIQSTKIARTAGSNRPKSLSQKIQEWIQGNCLSKDR